MLRIISQRLLVAIPVLFLVILVTFILIRLAPGGPFDEERAVPPQVLENLNKRYKLDDPLHVQFFDYLGNLLRGDFGPSFKYPSRTVTEVIYAGLPVTLELSCYALLVAMVFGIGAGVIAAMRPNTPQDYVPMSVAMVGICLPSFVLGPLLILAFGIGLEWLPVSGWGESPGDKILPSITLGAGYAAYVARLSRGGMLETLAQDYIRTARAKGLTEAAILRHHMLRNAAVPVITFAGLQAGALIGGAVVVETVFAWPGLGRLTFEAVTARDYPVLLGLFLVTSILVIAVNLLTDLLHRLIDPRVVAR